MPTMTVEEVLDLHEKDLFKYGYMWRRNEERFLYFE
jgi:hypothetical protein